MKSLRSERKVAVFSLAFLSVYVLFVVGAIR